MNQQLTDN